MAVKLSDRQHRMLKFIYKHETKNGFPPTIREIGKAVNISSTSVVNYNVGILVARGYLAKTLGKARTLTLTDQGRAIGAPRSTKRKITSNRDFLRDENRILRAELERLKRENQAQMNALRREMAYLQQELTHLRCSPDPR